MRTAMDAFRDGLRYQEGVEIPLGIPFSPMLPRTLHHRRHARVDRHDWRGPNLVLWTGWEHRVVLVLKEN